MTAEPLINKVVKTLAEHRLEAVRVGNAAAALRGAPVRTLDIDFMFRKTPANLKKLKAVACCLGATIFKKCYPQSNLYRLENEDLGIQVTFLSQAESREFTVEDSLRETRVETTNRTVTSRSEISGRDELRKPADKAQRTALKNESERALIDQIRRLLALPMNKRTNFLRVRRPGGGSHL